MYHVYKLFLTTKSPNKQICFGKCNILFRCFISYWSSLLFLLLHTCVFPSRYNLKFADMELNNNQSINQSDVPEKLR